MLGKENRKKAICIFLLIIGCFGGCCVLYYNANYKIKDQSLKGSDIFIEDYWGEIESVAFLDVNETRYEITDNLRIQEFVNMLFDMNYTEIENPWLEGGYLFEINTGEKSIIFAVVSDIIIIEDCVYKTSEEKMGEELKEFIVVNGIKTKL